MNVFNARPTPLMSPNSDVRMDDTALKAIRAAHRRKWTSIAALAAVVAAGAGVTWYTSASKTKSDQLVTRFLKAERQFQVERDAFIERIQAQKGASFDLSAKPDHTQSAKMYEEFAKENPWEPLGWVATLKAASSHVDKGDLDAAAALLESVVPKTMKHNLFQVRVRRTLAGIYADKGDFKKSLEQLEILEKIPDNPVVSENRLFAAKVHRLAGDNEKAAKILKDLASNPEFSLSGDRNSVANEASLWLGYWGL